MKSKKYLEIYKSIKNRILSGELAAMQKLPSKRNAALIYGCSIITIENAYKCLCDEGYILSKERSGYYVADVRALITDKNLNLKVPGLLVEDDGSPDTDFEYSVWFKTIRKVLSEKGEKLFIKAPNMGCAVLRNAISEYLLRYRGMYAPPERIVIGSGSEQLYETVIKIIGQEKIYGIEYPSYSQIEAVYLSNGVKIERLKMSEQGIETNALIQGGFDVLHVTPFRSYPTGVTASAFKRSEYISWSKNNRGYIVEDDFNSEFFIPGNPIESLYSLDKDDSVIYMNTFSKSISPSIRIGYMIIPESLMKKYKSKMGIFSCTVPVLDQYILAEFISSGNFERHLNRARRKMKDL